jgi:phosphoribosylamine--glycine ligase
MMDFYVMDSGIFFDVARCIWRTRKEGDRVYYFNFAEKKAFPRVEEAVGFGIDGVQKIYTIPWATIDKDRSVFVFTDVGFNFMSDLLKREGFKVFAGVDILEESRVFMLGLAGKSGIAVSPYWIFKNSKELRDSLVLLPSGKLVLKVSRVRGTVETRIFENKEELLSFVETLEKEVEPFINRFEWIVQKYVEGVEVALTAFFNGSDFLEPYFLNFEHEYGGAGWWVFDSIIMDHILLRIRELLRKLRFRGIIDANCIVNDKDVYLLEFTVRFASPGSRLYGRWITNFRDVVVAVASGEHVDIEVLPYKFGVYGECFRDPEVPVKAFYDVNELEYQNGWLVVDCPVRRSFDGRLYALSFFERLLVGAALGQTLEGAFNTLRKILDGAGPWTVSMDLERLESDIMARFLEFYKIEKKRDEGR